MIDLNKELDARALHIAASNVCSLHDFDPDFVAENAKFAMACIYEYRQAMQEAEFIEPVQAVVGGEVKTLRDEFAMQALNGILITPHTWHDLGYCPAIDGDVMVQNATMAYQYAAAMMEARK